MVLAAVHTTASAAAVWAIVIVAVASLAFWLVMVVGIAPRPDRGTRNRAGYGPGSPAGQETDFRRRPSGPPPTPETEIGAETATARDDIERIPRQRLAEQEQAERYPAGTRASRAAQPGSDRGKGADMGTGAEGQGVQRTSPAGRPSAT